MRFPGKYSPKGFDHSETSSAEEVASVSLVRVMHSADLLNRWRRKLVVQVVSGRCKETHDGWREVLQVLDVAVDVIQVSDGFSVEVEKRVRARPIDGLF